MSKEFFYTDPSAVHDGRLTIEGEEAKHIVRVLRKREGDLVWITDGHDRAYEAIISAHHDVVIECDILSVHEHLNEPEIHVTIAVAALKHPARMDWLVEKGTEIGVRRFIPVTTQRTIPHSSKENRWRNIAVAAMKQSCRSFLPDIFPLTDFETVLRHATPYDLKIIPYERTDEALFIDEVMRHRRRPTSVIILIGPEGGFTEEEVRLADLAGFVQVSLGKRRLRTETAAIVAAARVIGNY
jgi:16S rRNA (uracil1498-N3)-methyltransferase